MPRRRHDEGWRSRPPAAVDGILEAKADNQEDSNQDAAERSGLAHDLTCPRINGQLDLQRAQVSGPNSDQASRNKDRERNAGWERFARQSRPDPKDAQERRHPQAFAADLSRSPRPTHDDQECNQERQIVEKVPWHVSRTIRPSPSMFLQ